MPPKEELERLYIVEQKPLKSLAFHYNCSTKPIRRWLKHYNIPLRSKREALQIALNTDDKIRPVVEDLWQKYLNGYSYTRLAKESGHPKSNIRYWFQKYGFSSRPKKDAVALRVRTKLETYGYAHLPPGIKYGKQEQEVRDYLNSLGFNFVSTKSILKNHRELDGYDPTIQKAFEYCGLWWHSEANIKDKNYHHKKWRECTEKNIQLFTIFEDEWTNSPERVKQFLSARLGIFERRISARQCRLQLMTFAESKEFFQQNHIQGAPQYAHTVIGLTFENELVGAVSFNHHHRQNSDFKTTLNRLTFKSGVQIVGGARRLIKNAQRMFPNFITWSDNRWSLGEIYAQSGLRFSGDLPPDYSYINRKGERRSKQSMKKSRTGCPPDQTEKDWCWVHGWYRIWDCGKRVWVWDGDKYSIRNET